MKILIYHIMVKTKKNKIKTVEKKREKENV